MNFITHSPRRKLSVSLTCSCLACLLFLAGCNMPEMLDFRQKADIDLQAPSRILATQGMDDYNVGKYFTALEYFEEILDRFPFSPEATLAELKAADCNYYMDRYFEAFTLYNEFEERHPTNEAIPYVMFQKGMTYYKRIDRVDRDPSGATESIKHFDQLLRAYPYSPYTEEAKARIKEATEFLADHEYAIVKFYMRTKKYSQAEKRLKYILTMYPDSGIAPQAKELLALIEAGTPPDAGWKEWVPTIPLLNWPSTDD